jgi:phospholipid-binding lipoprotein MlaA
MALLELTKCALVGFAAATMVVAASAQGVVDDQPDAPVSQSEIDAAVWGTTAMEFADPWEGFNRKMFSAHLFMDENFLVPAAKAYRATTPKAGRRGIRRFLANIKAPGIFVNDILQGEFGRAGETFGRFVVNSTIGAGGFADPAAQIGIPSHSEDFGQTLAVWGVDSGPFMFLPLVGPTTTRDGFGKIVQIGMDPLFYVRTPPADIARYSRAGVGGVSAREQFLDPLAEIEEKSLDYYASLRSFYAQSRKREIANGVVDYSDLPDIGEFEEFDELN